MADQCTSAAVRHDYARTWHKVRPAERDRRITQALARLTEGETLAQVAATWRMSAGSLCRVLIAYAPGEWRRALAARAMVRYFEATDEYLADHQNSMARGRAWAARWHLEHALTKLANVATVSVWRNGFTGPCPNCGHGSAVWRGGEAVRCHECDWEGVAKRYPLDLPQTPAPGLASR